MKKIAFFATALMVLASCSNTDELMTSGGTQPSEAAISFDSPFVNKNTRSDCEITNDNIRQQEVTVWGLKYSNSSSSDAESVFGIDGESKPLNKVLKTSNSWQGDGDVAYWESDKTYDFIAITGQRSFKTTFTAADDHRYAYLSVANVPLVQQDMSYSVIGSSHAAAADIVVAKRIGISGVKKMPVQLRMNHALSRLDVYAYSQEGGDAVNLKSLKIYLPSSEKVCNFEEMLGTDDDVLDRTSDTWTFSGSGFVPITEAYSESDLINSGYKAYDLIGADGMDIAPAADAKDAIKMGDADTDTRNKSLCQYCFFIAPFAEMILHDGIYISATYTVGNNGEEKSVELTKVSGLSKFTAGRINKLVLRINGDGKVPITFEVQGTSWSSNDETNSEQDVKN